MSWSKLSHENGKKFKSVALMNRPRNYKASDDLYFLISQSNHGIRKQLSS